MSASYRINNLLNSQLRINKQLTLLVISFFRAMTDGTQLFCYAR